VDTFQKKLEQTKEKINKDKAKTSEPPNDDGFTLVGEKQRKKQEQEQEEAAKITDGKRYHTELKQFLEQKRNKTFVGVAKKIQTPLQKKQAKDQPVFVPTNFT